MPLTSCPYCRSQIQVADVGTEAGGQCQYCSRSLWLYKCFSCMKVTAFSPTQVRPRACPRCNTSMRSNQPLILQPIILPTRKRIVIEILESPGTGNVANAKNIYDALRRRYTVHIQVSGSRDAVGKIFGKGYMPCELGGDYDLLIVPGIEIRSRLKSMLRKPPPRVMTLPPPFCKHLFQPPCLMTHSSETVLPLDDFLPFLPLTGNWKNFQRESDYKGLKAKCFPTVNPADVFFIVTYLGLGAKSTDAFKGCEEHIIILNFGTHGLTATGTKNVVSMKCTRLPMLEFEECLLQCTTLYPAVTDGGNTVGTLQGLELPYYDLSFKRVMVSREVAFLNNGSCDMGVFKTLKSRATNIAPFNLLLLTTANYYGTHRQARQQGRGAAILFLVGQAFK